MAMSLTRPDPSSPASIADAAFATTRRGFDQSEVRDFLRMVAAELGRLQERERFLERELRTAQVSPDLSSVQLDDQTLTRLLGEETARVLTTARESAAEIRHKAEQAAAQLLSEASDEANRVREEADVEASRRRADAAADAEAELSMAKQQGREMVNEARAYRERVLSELARRRELAREQIEQLLHGRDRLMQSFERARLVAVDVVAELQPLGEPDEYVNLSPTTGPVPVMLPNTPRPDSTLAEGSEAADDETPTDASTTSEPDASDADPSGVDAADAATEGATEGATEDATEDATEGVVDEYGDAGDESKVGEAIEAIEVEQDTEADAEAGESGESGEPGESDEPRDDVVVDLFARIRADAVVDEPPAAKAAPETAPTPDTENAPEPAAEADAESVSEAVSEPDTEPGTEPDGATADAEEPEPTPFQRRDADLTPLIVASARKLKRVLADEQNEVLDALRRSEPVRHIDAILPPAAEHSGRYRVAIADDLLAAANAGAASAAPGRPAKLRKAEASKATAAGDDVLGEWLVSPLRERLERCVAGGDGDNSDITRRVRAVYREWKTQHIDDVLDDVIRTAHGRGVLGAVKAGTPVSWSTDDEHPGCADCDDNTLAGPVAAGTAFPTGHLFAPAHIGCRCLLVPGDR
jgi:DivIVA domain-containing protein